MKVVILAGGLGTRLSEETATKPKPMVEVGGYPLLWHIMNIYSSYGYNDFVIALGYKGEVIREYFRDFSKWNVELIDTGIDTMTGGRIKRLVDSGVIKERFMLTYGDGVGDIDIPRLLYDHYKQAATLATMTLVHPPPRFGHPTLSGDRIIGFSEKPVQSEWINGGFFVVEPEVVNYIADDGVYWEREPIERLASERSIAAHFHEGFWQCVDTMRDLKLLNEMWSKDPQWKIW